MFFSQSLLNLCRPHLDSEDRQVQLITTLDNTEVDLLTLEYIKVCDDMTPKLFPIVEWKTVGCSKDFCCSLQADKKGPEFRTQHNNTEQLIKVRLNKLHCVGKEACTPCFCRFDLHSDELFAPPPLFR